MENITFRLAAPLILPNRKGIAYNRQAAAGKVAAARVSMAREVMAVLGGPRPAVPFEYSSVQVFRHSLQEPDRDNLYASVKDLLDVLQPSHERRTFGLGIISNDKPSRCLLTVRHIQARYRSDQCTIVVIRQLPGLEAVRVAA